MVVLPGSLLSPFPPKSDAFASGREIARVTAACDNVILVFLSAFLIASADVFSSTVFRNDSIHERNRINSHQSSIWHAIGVMQTSKNERQGLFLKIRAFRLRFCSGQIPILPMSIGVSHLPLLVIMIDHD